MADDRVAGTPSQYSFAKHFDTLSYPRRLQPLRGMTAESVTNTLIGNMVVASDGLMYGVGTDPNNPTLGKLWVRSGYGASDVWGEGGWSQTQLTGHTANFDLLVNWPDSGASSSRNIFWASANFLASSQLSGGAGGAATQALTFSSIGQGLVHPKDKNLYFPYRTSSAAYIALRA